MTLVELGFLFSRMGIFSGSETIATVPHTAASFGCTLTFEAIENRFFFLPWFLLVLKQYVKVKKMAGRGEKLKTCHCYTEHKLTFSNLQRNKQHQKVTHHLQQKQERNNKSSQMLKLFTLDQITT